MALALKDATSPVETGLALAMRYRMNSRIRSLALRRHRSCDCEVEAVNGVATRVAVVVDSSQVSEARRIGMSMAAHPWSGFIFATGSRRIATEAATNLLKTRGQRRDSAAPLGVTFEPGGMEMLVLEQRPGMQDFSECLRDGYSTAGSDGLGAMLAAGGGWLNGYCLPGADSSPRYFSAAGSALRISPLSSLGPVGGRRRGESVCGDAWAVRETPAGLMVMVVDGLGHGAPAHEAALGTMDAFHHCAGRSPADVLDTVHRGIRHTRGACAAVVQIDIEAGNLVHCFWCRQTFPRGDHRRSEPPPGFR